LRHFTSPDFWYFFSRLPAEVQEVARENYEVLKQNPRHPSLHLKKARAYWSVRVGRGYRALGKDVDGGILWGWIGGHDEYMKILSSQ
jgi:hypothetical protein